MGNYHLPITLEIHIMKLHFKFFIRLTVITFFISACNFTLAEDITPPPNYVSPTPAPTLALYPADAPSVEIGAAIYVEKCAPCHGETGMGDGPQGIQLQGVTVPAFGLPEVARPASLAQWYTVVTRGNIERFMPPFASLSDQERWDVVAYAMTFHTTQEEIGRGRELFEANCADCSIDYFQDQSKMSSLSEVELARIIKEGNEEVKAFGENLEEEEVWAVAAYLRTLSFADSSIAFASTPLPSQTQPAAISPTVAPVEGTPVAGAAQSPVPVERQPGFGSVSGSVENQTGAELPSGLKINLRGFDHGTDPNSAPEEILSLEASVDEQGNYIFENVEMPEGRIFLAQTSYERITFQSEFGVTEEGAASLTLSPIKLYGTTEDPSALVIDDARIFFDYAENAIQVYGVYSFRNISDKALVVALKDGVEIPFMKSPNGAQPLGFEPTQDSQPFTSINDNIAFPPSEESYGLIVFSTMARESQVEVTHPFVLPVDSLTVFLPAGVSAEGSQLADHGVQTIEGLNFQMYAAGDLPAGSMLTFTLSGTPSDASTSESTLASEARSNRSSILIAAGVLGLALIAAGAWMFLRDRQSIEGRSNKEEETDFESPEEVMDAIIVLDDLHQAKRISNQAYQKRRSELKEILKEMM
jgi:mono/diheme cytochrome c family protein